MFILDLVSVCGNHAIVPILAVFVRVLDILHIIAPVLLLVGLGINIFKLVKFKDFNEEKKLKKQITNQVIATVVIFLLPYIVNLLMWAISQGGLSVFDVADCWDKARSTAFSTSSSYQQPDSPYSDGTTVKISDADVGEGSDGVDPNKIYKDKEKERQKKRNNSSSNSGTGGNTSGGTSSLGPGSSGNRKFFIGDSRTVQMYINLYGDWNTATVNKLAAGTTDSKNDVWSCKGSMGLDWMKSTGVPNIEGSIASDNRIIILMGVNDLDNVNGYISYINGKAAEWKNKGAKTYFVSVTQGSAGTLSTRIPQFNNTMKSSLSGDVTYLDAYGYLNTAGWHSADGVHYDKATYEKIYNFINSNT